jgi:dienelactone hydrolase
MNTDFISQEPFPTSKHPPKSPQDSADLQAFFGADGAAYFPSNVGKLVEFARALKSSGVKRVGAYGFCWGMFQQPPAD